MESHNEIKPADVSSRPEPVNESSSDINFVYIDPAKEEAALKKFDKYYVPVVKVRYYLQHQGSPHH